METSTTIRRMLAGNRINVPTYQRAYSWETPRENIYKKTHTDVFFKDLNDYTNSSTVSSFYFGHFLFEDKGNHFCVIDGQQRLTTIVIFLSALFAKLKSLRDLTVNENECFEDIIKRGGTFRFNTVDYDNQLFKDYVIEQTKKDENGLETESAKRIVSAYNFFLKKLAGQDEKYLIKMLETICESTCTTHQVKNESEAIQMFIFQNNRGKQPSNLEIIKALFMYNVHLYGGENTPSLIDEIKQRFEKIYKCISSIEYRIDEDEILIYTLRVYFNSLWESNSLEKIYKQLEQKNPTHFIKSFSQLLSVSFENLNVFFRYDEKTNCSIHSLVSLGGISLACPFIIKAYKFGLNTEQIGQLCNSLESLVLRDKLIGTRADLTSRINDIFTQFTEANADIEPIIKRIEFMKTTDNWWWAYWNNNELEKSLQGGLNHSIAKFLLWKYENFLTSQGKAGYTPCRFDKIIDNPELEHIAPSTEPAAKPHGYDDYTEEFYNQYLNCLGNYLLISKPHNGSVSNIFFSEKHKTYTHLAQQLEIQNLVSQGGIWSKELIQKRKEKILEFIMKTF